MRLALAIGVLLLCSCRVNSSGLIPDEATDDGAVTSGDDTALPKDAIVSDTAPVFPVDDSSAVPECTGTSDGTVCGATSPRHICIGGECLPSRCGDGIVDVGEDCDDKNTVDGDNCPGDCMARCKSNPDCDDKNACSVDTCDLTRHVCAPSVAVTKGTVCTLAAGGSGVCNGTLCTAPNCGNKIVEVGEDCDDGNTNNYDGCRSDCTWTCSSDASCDNGNACDGVETCDLSKHTCRVPPPKDCRDGNPCTDDRCVAPGGACMSTLRDLDGDGSPCGKDCHDGNPRVHPGVTAWFTAPYASATGGPSYDYDCSGTEEKRFTNAGACVKAGGGACTHTWGWAGATPNCGASEHVVAGCEAGNCKQIISATKVPQECH